VTPIVSRHAGSDRTFLRLVRGALHAQGPVFCPAFWLILTSTYRLPLNLGAFVFRDPPRRPEPAPWRR